MVCVCLGLSWLKFCRSLMFLLVLGSIVMSLVVVGIFGCVVLRSFV